jgi:uncharacterized protein YbcV (DUF1398 family)
MQVSFRPLWHTLTYKSKKLTFFKLGREIKRRQMTHNITFWVQILVCKRTRISVKPLMKTNKGSQLQDTKKVICNKKLIDIGNLFLKYVSTTEKK